MDGTDGTVYERLSERFGEHHTRRQAGVELVYLTGEQVVARLNDVLGVSGWSFRVVAQGTTDVEAWVLGEIGAWIDGMAVTRQQYGNQDIQRGDKLTTDLFKSAATDALKKCASLLGVGLYLYDAEERREVQAEMRQFRPGLPVGSHKAAPTTTEDVRAAAMVTGAAPAAHREKRAAREALLQRGLLRAKVLDLEVATVDVATLTDAELEDTIKALAVMIRAAEAQTVTV